MIDLLRHGHTGFEGFRGQTDDPLNELGWQQMRHTIELTLNQQGFIWDQIVSSPLKRCSEFASKLARTYAVPLHIETRLSEFNFGKWEGFTASELLKCEESAKQLSLFWDDPWRLSPPSGETMVNFEGRLRAAWIDLLLLENVSKNENLLVITHAGVIRMILCRAKGMLNSEMWSIAVDHASLHSITKTDFLWT